MKKIGLQILKFLGFSGIGWLIDFSLFNLLTLFFDSIDINNIISSLCGVSFVFMMSTRKTFVRKENGINLKWKFIIYICYQLVLIFVMSKLLLLICGLISTAFSGTFLADYSAFVSKILVTPITMTVNFIVMKLLIERI